AVELVTGLEDADLWRGVVDVILGNDRVDHPDLRHPGLEVFLDFDLHGIGRDRVADDLDGQVGHDVPCLGSSPWLWCVLCRRTTGTPGGPSHGSTIGRVRSLRGSS